MKIAPYFSAITMAGLFVITCPLGIAAEKRLETPSPVSGRSLSDPVGILPADVLARVKLLRANLDLLRRYMGLLEAPQPKLQSTSAVPREVYSQALNLEMRAHRLAFEQVRIVRNQSLPVRGETIPADVFRLVDSALSSILLVKQDMNIRAAIAEQVQSEQTTPTEVFNAVVVTGTEINNLLQDRTAPSDVFQLLTSATHIAASLHATIPGKRYLPDEPDFEPNRMPADVFLRLRRCFDMVSQLAQLKGINTLDFSITDEVGLNVYPNDVSDMAALLVEELRSVHGKFPNARQPTHAYYPGKRFPSHVYQRAGLLEQILQDLIDEYVVDSMSSDG